MSTPCVGKWALFDSTDPRDHAFAATLCADCPILADCLCLVTTVREPTGTWAGQLYGERSQRRYELEVPACGTERGYQRHRHRGEKCDECRAAHAAHVTAWKRERRAS